MDQEKTITIVDLKPVSGNKKDGSGVWTKYNIRGNDGITYTTFDQNFFLQRKIGETVNLTFYTTTYQGQRGLVTNYNIVTEKSAGATGQYTPPTPGAQPSRVNPGINPQVAAILAEMKKTEVNIIAAIRVHCGTNVLGAERKPLIPVIEENGKGGYAVAEEEEEEAAEPVGDNNPF